MTQSLPTTEGSGPDGLAAIPGRRSWLEINLSRIESNARLLQQCSGPAPDAPNGDLKSGSRGAALCGVIKKDGYGLGAVALARRLIKAGAAMLAVYDLAEAAALLEAGVTAPLLVLMPTWRLTADEAGQGGEAEASAGLGSERAALIAAHARAGRLQLAIHDPRQISVLEAAGRSLQAPVPVHLYLDTGMSRAGLSESQFGQALMEAGQCAFVRVAGVYSHLATADADGAFAAAQRRRFEQALALHRELIPAEAIRHLANTCGTLRDPALHFDMVRPGLGLLGFGPEQMPADAGPDASGATDEPSAGLARSGLAPAVRWLSFVSHVQRYRAGRSVGYGATDVLESERLLATVPVGYGDGYPLALSNRAAMRVWLPDGRWHTVAVRGRVNMDETVIDLTDAVAAAIPVSERSAGGVARNDGLADHLLHSPVEVYSDTAEAENAIPRLAAMAETHCYELLCRIAPHVGRRHVEGEPAWS